MGFVVTIRTPPCKALFMKAKKPVDQSNPLVENITEEPFENLQVNYFPIDNILKYCKIFCLKTYSDSSQMLLLEIHTHLGKPVVPEDNNMSAVCCGPYFKGSALKQNKAGNN